MNRARLRICLLGGFCATLLVASPIDAEAASGTVVGLVNRSAGPATVKLASAFGQSRAEQDTEGIVVRPDHEALPSYVGSASASFDAVVSQQWASENACSTLANRFPASNHEAYLIGERRLAVVVHPSNGLKVIRLTALHRILAALEGDKAYEPDPTRHPDREWPLVSKTPALWNECGGETGMPVRVYAEGESSWTREELRFHYLKWLEHLQGCDSRGGRPFRRDITVCVEADDVVNRVRRDVAGIGLVQYTGQKLVGVKVLAVEDDFPKDWSGDFDVPGPILPVKSDGTVNVLAWEEAAKRPRTRGPVELKQSAEVQPEYPLSEPLLLYVHPKAPQNVKDFAKFCVSERGADVAEGLGFITPRQHFLLQAQRRLAQARRGDCPTITICTDTKGRRLTRELALAYTREISPLRVQPRADDSKAMGGAFVARPLDLMLSIGVPDAKFSGRKWQESLAAGQVKPHAIASHTIAIIAHEQLGKAELTWDELLWIAKGKVKNWGEMGVKIGQGPAATAPALDGQLPQALDDAIVLAMPDRRDATTRRFTRLLDGVNPADGDHRDSDAEVISAVQANPGTIGIINATSIPDDLDKRKLRVMAIKIRNRSVRPTEAEVFTGEYPLAEGLYLWTRPATPAHAQAFLDAIMTSPRIAEVIRAAGLLPVSAR